LCYTPHPQSIHTHLHFELCFAARASSAVAWQQLQRQRRLSVTAAARQVSAEGASKRRFSREQRKAMVEAYVAKWVSQI